jgi:hypothetical protein
MPWTQPKRVLARLALFLAIVAAVPCVIAFTWYYGLTAWRRPARQVSSLAEIPTIGRSLSAWQTAGPVYYRYRPGFGKACSVVVAGVTSSEAIAAFRAVGRHYHDWSGTTPKRITEVVGALSSVPGFAFKQSEENLSFCCGVDSEIVCASFDPRSGWFVAMVDSSSDWREN